MDRNPTPFDAAAWIERVAPGALAIAGSISDVFPAMLVKVAAAAHTQGCVDESARVMAKLAAISEEVCNGS